MDLVMLVAVCAFGLRAVLLAPSGTGDACDSPDKAGAPSGRFAGWSAVDRWTPYMEAASRRFGVPQRWLREVMRVGSDGAAFATSEAGAMGLMQLMPQTYAELSERYGLGDDPYDPPANIAAGAAYLREMYERFGALGAFVAYPAHSGQAPSGGRRLISSSLWRGSQRRRASAGRVLCVNRTHRGIGPRRQPRRNYLPCVILYSQPSPLSP